MTRRQRREKTKRIKAAKRARPLGWIVEWDEASNRVSTRRGRVVCTIPVYTMGAGLRAEFAGDVPPAVFKWTIPINTSED